MQQVTLISEPAGASVLLDGKDVGITPWTGETAPGQHQLVIQLPGYRKVERSFNLGGDHATELKFQLLSEREAGPAPPGAGRAGR